MAFDKIPLWVDLETTGFHTLRDHEVYRHQVLEVAACVTDENYNVVSSLNIVIHHRPEDIIPLMDEVVLNMHKANGLIEEAAKSTVTLTEAQKQILDFCNRNGIEPRAGVLAGNSILLDRNFIDVHLPELDKYLHYHQIDMTSVCRFLHNIDPTFIYAKKKTHRAMDDILESIAEASFYHHKVQKILEMSKRRHHDTQPSP